MQQSVLCVNLPVYLCRYLLCWHVHVCVLVLGGTTLFVVVLCIIMHFLVLSEVAEQREEKKKQGKISRKGAKGVTCRVSPPRVY